MNSKNFDFYIDNQDELVKLYKGKYLVIRDETIAGNYDNETDAYFDAIEKYEAGSFIIQYCGIGEEGYAQHFHSRVIFA